LRKRLAWIAVIALLFAALPGAYAATQIEELMPLVPATIYQLGEMNDETPQLWFVELAGKPVSEGGNVSSLSKEKKAFRAEMQAAGIGFAERYSYSTLWNGISASIAPGQLSKVAQLPGVKAIYPVELISIPETEHISPDLAYALTMTGADVVHDELGYTGLGVKVAVMDTGIDYLHPDLGGGWGERVIAGWDFVGDDFDASNPDKSTPVPDDDPMDANGHGTHVAGIIGARGTVTGVAPDVEFGAYKVFGAEGSTTADIMLAAMEMALADGMQVLNMSIGSGYQWPNYPTAKAADRLVNKGMVVVASIGNNGANGLYSAGAPGVGEKVIGVASFDNVMITRRVFTVSPDATSVGYTNAAGAPLAPTEGSVEVALADLLGNPVVGDSFEGKAALVSRGVHPFYTKATNAQAAGASAVVLYNNMAGLISPTVAGDPPVTIPVVAIAQADGLLIAERLDAGVVTLTWTDEVQSIPNPTAGRTSSFSSYGLAPDLSLKPDIGAPGGMIFSTYPRDKGEYASLSGTSMSSPHVAGAVALLLEAQPKTNAQVVRTVLQNSADPQMWWGNPGLGYLDNVHRQGAGMLDIPGAILATTRISPAKLALGESEAGAVSRTLTVENKAASAMTFSLSYTNALSTGANTFALSFWTSDATVAFSQQTVTVPAGGKTNVTATITPSTGPEGGQYGGYIVFTPEGDGPVYRVPFAGYMGDYQARTVLTPAGHGFPLLGRQVGEDVYDVEQEGAVFTMVDGDIPYFLIHLDHQCELLRAEVFEAGSGKAWHKAFELRYLPRNSTATGFFAFDWDGSAMRGNKLIEVPNGDYVVKVSVLKALGDPSNPEHWEIWTSPYFSIARPGSEQPSKPGNGPK